MTRSSKCPPRKRKSGPSGVSTIPLRSIRVPSELWESFGRLCVSHGTDRSKALNAYMAAEIEKSRSR